MVCSQEGHHFTTDEMNDLLFQGASESSEVCHASEEANASESHCSQWPGASAFLPGSTDFEFMVVRDNTEMWGFTTE